MKNKKGFTLIELLAVIVVLAIIALIATPIVMNTIKNAKKGAAERSADNYVKAVEQKVAESRIDGTKIANRTYNIQPDGNLCPASGCGENDKDKITIDMSGTKPTSGKIKITNGSVDQSSSSMTVGSYEVAYNPTTNKYEAMDKGSTTPDTPQPTKTYTNGEVVYFNVDNGTKCSNYTETQSNTGTKSGCMKFYAFNDDGKDTVNLILDHNTTALVAWNSSGNNADGPITLLAQLQSDTKLWQGTETPSNYTMDQTGETSNAKYTIDYSGYKARLITAQEIATITDYSGWDEKVSANSKWYYFDSKTTTESDTCKSGDTSGCQYGWLYDRTSKDCTTNGCLNNSDQTTTGYWTNSSFASDSDTAWIVYYFAGMDSNIVSNSFLFGVRPVITVLKSNLN
jgi:type IV pilus assembly protein PilA